MSIFDKIKRSKKDVLKNKNQAIDELSYFLNHLIESKDKTSLKKADLLSYWIKNYTNYIKNEKKFIPAKQENYKRGNIIKVDLGFNIGNEEGGLHYAIVINNPDKTSGNVVIVPLTSMKPGKKLHRTDVLLDERLFEEVLNKAELILKDLQEKKKNIGKGNCIENLAYIDAKILEVKKYLSELKRLKKTESIALVGNITTISKQRVYTPTISNTILKGISISDEQLDLIDNKIKELYTKNKKSESRKKRY